jgi:type IV pilus assembly protein PilM
MAVPRIIGLDIGSNAIKMVEIDRAKNELQFAGMAVLPDGAIVDKSIKKADLVGNAITALYKSSKSRNKQVATSLAGKAVIVKLAKDIPSMTDAQLEKQIQMVAEQYIPFEIKEVELDFFIMGESLQKEGSMEAVLVAARKDYMAEYIELIKSINLVPVVVDVDLFALEVMFETCYLNIQEEIVALVNVGAGNVNVNILRSGASQLARDLPLGGDAVTREIMRFFDVDFNRAENIKRGSQLDKINPRNLRKIFQRSVEYIVSELQKVLDHFSTNISYDPIQKIFLSGGAAATYGLQATMEQELNIPVEIVDPFRSFKVDEKIFDVDYLNNIGAQMAVAVGLALRDERDKQV